MKYINWPTDIVHSPEFLGSSSEDLAIWLRGSLFNAFWEHSGRVSNAFAWPTQQWSKVFGAPKSKVLSVVKKGLLLKQEGNDLVIWAYPLHLEQEIQAKRFGGRKRWSEASSASCTASTESNSSPQSTPSTTADTTGQSSASTSAGGNSNSNSNSNKYSNTPKPPTTDVVEEIYWAYPKHSGKRTALKAITKALQEIDAATLLERTKAYAAAVATWPNEKLEFRPDPATWFNGGRYDDDQAEWYRYSKKSRVHPLGGEIDPEFDSSKPNAHTGGIPLAN